MVIDTYFAEKESLFNKIRCFLHIDVIEHYFTLVGFEIVFNQSVACFVSHAHNHPIYIFHDPDELESVKIRSNHSYLIDLLLTDVNIYNKLDIFFNKIIYAIPKLKISLSYLNNLYKDLITSFYQSNISFWKSHYKNIDKDVFCDDLRCTKIHYFEKYVNECLLEIKNDNVTIEIVNCNKGAKIKSGYKFKNNNFKMFIDSDSKHIIRTLSIFCLKIDLYDPMKYLPQVQINCIK